MPYFILAIYEYIKYNDITIAKNAALLTAVTKGLTNTYLYTDINHFHIMLAATFSGFYVYMIRYYLYQNNIRSYNTFFTYVFHFCFMTILYISSITAK